MARKFRVPVISAADNGDNSIINVERFDVEPKRAIYHGSLGKVDLNKIKTMGFNDRVKLINKMVGFRYVTKRMKESLRKVGRELYGWPQLGGAALLGGALATYVVRKIALGEALRSGMYNVKIDQAFA
jgi:hypothetical protein